METFFQMYGDLWMMGTGMFLIVLMIIVMVLWS